MFLILFINNFMTVVTSSSSHFVHIWISFRLAAGHHALSSAHRVFCMPTDTKEAVNPPHVDASWCRGSETSRFATFFNSSVPRRKTLADTHTWPFHCLSLWSKPRNATGIFWQARWPRELYAEQVFTMCQDGKGYISETEHHSGQSFTQESDTQTAEWGNRLKHFSF